MEITYRGIRVNYSITGTGPAVVLLHGFLEDSTMWDNYVPNLQLSNTVITIDLLGHGKTECIGYIHSMQHQSELVLHIVDLLKINTFSILGHSMGGYVALALAKIIPDRITQLCLLNSTFKADSEERKNLRRRAIKMAHHNYENIVRLSFMNLFSETSKRLYTKPIAKALQTALNTSKQSFIAATEGMIVRDDLTEFFCNASFKKSIVLGKKDILINPASITELTKNSTISSV